ADKKRREEIDLKNEADQLIFTTEKTLKDLEGKIDEAEITSAEEAKEALKKAVENNVIEEIRQKKDALQEIVQNLSMKLYEQAAQQAGAEQGSTDGNQGKNDDNVVDADFEEVEDDKENK